MIKEFKKLKKIYNLLKLQCDAFAAAVQTTKRLAMTEYGKEISAHINLKDVAYAWYSKSEGEHLSVDWNDDDLHMTRLKCKGPRDVWDLLLPLTEQIDTALDADDVDVCLKHSAKKINEWTAEVRSNGFLIWPFEAMKTCPTYFYPVISYKWVGITAHDNENIPPCVKEWRQTYFVEFAGREVEHIWIASV